MRLWKSLRWHTAGLVALLMGFPVAEKAMAGSDAIGITDASLSLFTAILDAAGNS